METWQTLGRQIRALRERRGLTRPALAQRVDLASVYVKKMEAGERVPSLNVLQRLARALHATLHVRLTARRSRRG